MTARTIKNATTDAVISTETFTYDAAGNITGGSASTTFVYDTNNRLVTYNGNAVSYDLDGNMLNNGVSTFTYDSSNKLITAGNCTYTYNAEDVRIRNICGNADTTYTYDTNCKLSKLLMKTTNNVVTKYVYGLGLIGEETSNVIKVYHFDYRGSTVVVTDSTGAITDTFEYDTYGKVIARTGTSDIIFYYNGRDGVATDTNGLFYMRARYYSPDMRRFVNADILHGKISDSTSINRYSYANGNPVSFIDPFGLSSRDSSDLFTIEDIQKLQEIYEFLGLGLEMSDMTVEAMYRYLREGLETAVRPNNIGVGVWRKQIENDIKWVDDLLGPSSKISKHLDLLSLPWIDALSIGVNTTVNLYDNIKNGESQERINAEIVTDIFLGTGGVLITAGATKLGAFLGSFIPIPIVGTAVGSILGFAVGLLIDETYEYFTEKFVYNDMTFKEYAVEYLTENQDLYLGN